MRALTLWPEWAWAVARLGKDVENRSWPAPGWIIGQDVAIHAGRHVGGAPRAQAFAEGIAAVRVMAILAGLDPGPLADWLNELRAGVQAASSAVLAVARIGRGRTTQGDGWAVPGQHHWWLEAVRPLPAPVPCRGAQGLWVVPKEVEQAILAGLAGRAT